MPLLPGFDTRADDVRDKECGRLECWCKAADVDVELDGIGLGASVTAAPTGIGRVDNGDGNRACSVDGNEPSAAVFCCLCMAAN